jgi:transcriptional regulator with XRE-family HTH domain
MAYEEESTVFMKKSEKAGADLRSISQGQLSKIECGKLGPSADTLIRLVDRFGKSADWILSGKG